MKTLRERHDELENDIKDVYNSLLKIRDKYDLGYQLFSTFSNADDILKAYKAEDWEYLAYEADALYELYNVFYLNDRFEEVEGRVLSVDKNGIKLIDEDLNISVEPFYSILSMGDKIGLIELMANL